MNTDAYTTAYWNAHNDPTNADRWHTLYDEARTLGWAARKAGDKDEALRWFDTARAAHVHYMIASDGTSPLSDTGRKLVAARI